MNKFYNKKSMNKIVSLLLLFLITIVALKSNIKKNKVILYS